MLRDFLFPFGALEAAAGVHDDPEEVEAELLDDHLHDEEGHQVDLHVDVDSDTHPSLIDPDRHVLRYQILVVDLHEILVHLGRVVQLPTDLRVCVDRPAVHEDRFVVAQPVVSHRLEERLSLRKQRQVVHAIPDLVVAV